MKIARKYMAHFINTAVPGEDADYERLGKDLTEYSPEMSAKVEKNENIIGETNVTISGYEKTAAVEPYQAEKGSALFNRLQSIVDNALVLDDLKTDVVDVKLWEEPTVDSAYPAIKEEAYIEVTSYGGDTTAYQIPFTVHYTGVKTHGSFDVKTRKFTPTT